MTFNKSTKQRNKLAVSQNLFYSQSIKIGWNTLQESQCKDSIRWPSSQVFKAWRNSHPRCCWGYLLVITHCCLCSWTTASAQLYSFDRHLAHSLGPLWVIKLLQMMDGRASQGHSCRVSRVNTAVQITNVVNTIKKFLFLFQSRQLVWPFSTSTDSRNFIKMPGLDLALIDQLGRDLHTSTPGLMSEDQICPWTLFLTMALTLLKGELRIIIIETSFY